MNTLTEQDRKLAETLKSLSLPPQADAPKPRGRIRRWLAGAALLAAIPVILILVAPDTIGDIEMALRGQTEPAAITSTPSAPPERDSRPTNAKTLQAAARELTGSGYVIAPRSTTVFSKYEGRITRLAVDVGDQVQAGQILAVLEDAGASLALEQAKAAKVSADLVLAARDIALAQAAASFRRAESLAQRDATSRKDVEATETAWKNASNTVEQGRQDAVRADLAIRAAQERVDELTVRAPFAGTVTQLSAHIGDTILARADSVRESQGILALTDLTSMVIDADMAEANAALLRPGLPGEAVLDGFPDRPFRIELQRVAPIASAEKGTIGLRLSLIDPPAGIRPNMAARIRITVPETRNQSEEAQP